MFYQTTVTLPSLRLKALLSLLVKVESQAKEKGIDDATILDYRLIADMFPLVKQIQIATDNAKGMASRLAHREIPQYKDTETTLVELQARLQKTIDYLATFTEDDFADAATAEAHFPYFKDVHMVGADYVIGYGLPNFFFHIVTAYDILRQHGFEVGKGDYMDGSLIPFVPNVV